MKRVERYKVLRVVATIGVLSAILLVSHAFDTHNRTLLAVGVVAAFAAMYALSRSLRRPASAELLMSEDWQPHDRFNPYTGLPMVDGAVDIQGNLYGTHSGDAHRRGG